MSPAVTDPIASPARREAGNAGGTGCVGPINRSGRRGAEMQTDVRRRFRSIETVDPTTLTIDGDRVVVSHGAGTGAVIVIPTSEIVRVKVRVLLGIATLL